MTAALLKQLNDSAAVQDWAGAAQALSGLCALAGKQAERREISALLAGRAAVYGALASDEPKARKNAARLLSAIGTPDDAPALIAALGRERTRFVVPSLLLALGAAGGAAALEALCAYAPPTPQTPEEEKHCAEIRAALEKALARLTPAPTVALHALRAPRTVLLKHPEGFADALLDELRALGLPGKATAEGVLTSTQDLDALYGARCFGEALLPCGQVLLAPQEIALAARQGWTSLCAADEAGAPDL